MNQSDVEKSESERVEYEKMLNTKTVAELKNLITTIVKNVRFKMTGAKKNDMVDHLVRYTKYYKKNNMIGLLPSTSATLTYVTENLVRDTSKTASGAPRKVRADKGVKKIKESKTIQKIVVPMPVKKSTTEYKKMESDKAMVAKQEVPKLKKKLVRSNKPPMVITSTQTPKMLPTVSETNYVKKEHPPGFKLRKKRSDAGEPRKKKEKMIE